VRQAGRVTKGLVVAVLVVASSLAIGPSGSGAAPGAPHDARQDRERVRQEAADVASQLDVLRATNAQVEQALADLQANVAGQEAALADAQRAAAEAEAALAAAQQREAETQARIDEVNGDLRTAAVEAYINAGSLDDTTAMLDTGDIDDAIRRQSLVNLRAGQYQEVLDELRSLSEDLAIAREQAHVAADAADAHQADAANRLSEVQSARDQQASVAADVDARIEHALGEAANLESLDNQLAQQIAAEQAAIAARNRAAGGGGGGGTRSPTRVVGNGDIVNVGGIQVDRSIADQLGAMLDAAAADGITLGGGGYRSSDSQIALRRAHCGSSDYAIYEMPPGQCHPPTARPGQSMHEQGLAIDFTYQGRVISSHSSPAFQWLASHAASYGFYNLPSEPWHWSVNGN
jgi:hypothetical protein